MTVSDVQGVHHVVFCVRDEHLDAAVEFWQRVLGLEFEEILMPEHGLRIHLAWEAGIELIAPRANAGEAAAPFHRFLDTRGEGVYSVVVRTHDMSSSLTAAEALGAMEVSRQEIVSEGHDLTEVRVEPLFGMPVMLMQTSRPG